MATLTDLWRALDRLGDRRAAGALACSLGHLRNLRAGRKRLSPDQASRLGRAVGLDTRARTALRHEVARPDRRELARRLRLLATLVARYRIDHPDADALPTLAQLDDLVRDVER